MNADRSEDSSPDEIRTNMSAFYQECFEDQLRPLVEAGEITPDEAVRAVKMVMAQWFVQDTIESFVARHTGGLH